MLSRLLCLSLISTFSLAAGGCGDDGQPVDETRRDDAWQIAIDLDGSLQNAAFSPAGDAIVLTRFERGYNREPADLYVAQLGGGAARALVSDGSANVNLPGSTWNAATERIVFSSSREPHDEIFTIDDGGSSGDEVQVTSRADHMAYEPSFSPDGSWIVFESHLLDQEGDGVIMKVPSDGSQAPIALTDPADDCRQPNWSPAGDKILYQSQQGGAWDIWVMNTDGSEATQATPSGPGDKTDASFSPNGEWIVYSSDEGDLDLANIFIIPITGGNSARVTDWDGYDGAPSWSSDGARIAFESFPGDPDDSAGTSLWLIDAPAIP